jgi:hypothetical protein
MAMARNRLSRIAFSVAPKGEFTKRRQHKQRQQHGDRIAGCRAPAQVKLKAAQQRPHHHALQTVGTAGEPVQLVSQFHQNQSNAQGHHQAGQIGATQNSGTAQGAQNGGCQHAHQQTQQRIGHHQLGKQGRRIGTHAKKSGVPQRHDAGVAQNQIQRQRKQRHHGNLIDDQGMAGQNEG